MTLSGVFLAMGLRLFLRPVARSTGARSGEACLRSKRCPRSWTRLFPQHRQALDLHVSRLSLSSTSLSPPGYDGTRVIAKCSSMLAGMGVSGTGASSINPIDTSFHQGFSRAYEELAGRGERLLACAMLPLDRQSFPEGYEFSDNDYPDSGELSCVGEGFGRGREVGRQKRR